MELNQKECADQVRAQLSEFYNVVTTFVLADTFLVGFSGKSIDTHPYLTLLFLGVNLIWFFALLLTSKWVDIWVERLRESGEETNPWKIRTKPIIFGLGLRKFFLFLPLIFATIFYVMSPPFAILVPATCGGLLIAIVGWVSLREVKT